MTGKIADSLRQLGPLRVFMALVAALLVLFAPGSGDVEVYEGFGMVRTVLIPALTPIVFMLLMLDALMSRVMMGERGEGDRRRYRNIIRFNLVVGMLLLVSWLPFFLATT
ncbi:MAG: hypothetical protein JSW10_09420 [Pseudomonadota bacterium]|nr:MAG: hypothetical protein JSW10_09420 [Pseudomonadota bacterium]